jgi:hypothetical protein
MCLVSFFMCGMLFETCMISFKNYEHGKIANGKIVVKISR